jgi:hypothetical protein
MRNLPVLTKFWRLANKLAVMLKLHSGQGKKPLPPMKVLADP